MRERERGKKKSVIQKECNFASFHRIRMMFQLTTSASTSITPVYLFPSQYVISSAYISLSPIRTSPSEIRRKQDGKKNLHRNPPFPLPQAPSPITQHPRSNSPQRCHPKNSTNNQPGQNHRYNFKHNNRRHKCKRHDKNGCFDFLAAARPTRRAHELRIRRPSR